MRVKECEAWLLMVGFVRLVDAYHHNVYRYRHPDTSTGRGILFTLVMPTGSLQVVVLTIVSHAVNTGHPNRETTTWRLNRLDEMVAHILSAIKREDEGDDTG